MGKRKAIKASAAKKSAKAATSSAASLSGNMGGPAPTKGHVRKAKHHQAQEKAHREQSRGIGIHRDTGKVKPSRGGAARQGTGSTGRSPSTRAIGRGLIAGHDKAAAAHGAAKRAHIKAAKSRKKKDKCPDAD